MKRFFSTAYNDTAFNIALFFLRVGLGVLLLPHGYQKLIHFGEMKSKFMNFMGIGSTASLALVLFAELFCAVLLIFGFLSRFAALVIFFLFCVIVFKVNNAHIFGKGEGETLFLIASFSVLLVGPGKYSGDGAMGK